MNKGWSYVFIGALFEVLWVTGLKHADDAFSWIGTFLAISLSFYMVIRSISAKLPVGTVYAVFTGLGTSGTVLVEMTVFDEPVKLVKLALIAILLIGVIGLKAVTKEPAHKGSAA